MMLNLLFQAITEYVYELLQSDDVGLKKLEIPQEKWYSTLSFQKQVWVRNHKLMIFTYLGVMYTYSRLDNSISSQFFLRCRLFFCNLYGFFHTIFFPCILKMFEQKTYFS